MAYGSRRKTFKLISQLLVIALLLSVLGSFVPSAGSTQVTYTITAVADNYINGAAGSEGLNYGIANPVTIRNRPIRGLLRFDVSAIPVGAKVETATVQLYQSSAAYASDTFNMHKMNRSWIEGTNNGIAGTGADWNTFDGTNPWTTLGGDYTPAITASAITPNLAVGWVNFGVTTDTQSFVDNPAGNYGWLVKYPTEPGTVNRFYYSSKESATNKPTLQISYIIGDTTITPASASGGSPTPFRVRLSNTGGVNGDQMNEATFTIPAGYTAIAGASASATAFGKTWTVTTPPGATGPTTARVTASSAANDLTDGQYVDVNLTATTPLTTGNTTWTSGIKGAAGGWYIDPTPATVNVATVDTTPPITSLSTSPVVPNGDAGWFKTGPTITLTSNEPGVTQYQWDATAPASWNAYAGAGLLGQQQGTHTLYYRSIDGSNNTETPALSQVFNIDTGLPADPTSLSSPTHTTGTPSNNNVVTVDFSGATDTVSGLEGYSASWSQGATATPDLTVDMAAGAVTTTSPALTPDANWYFNIRTKDIAGNWTATKYMGPFVIDTAAPASSLSTVPVTPNGTGGWFITNPSITLSRNEPGTSYYQWDSTATWNTYAAPFSGLEGQHTLYYYAVDTAGNTETPTLSTLFKVDTTAPSVTSTNPNNGATSVLIGADVTATFSEDMDAATIDTTNFVLKDIGNTTIPASVSYDGPSKTAILNPTGALGYESTYTATITTAVKDAQGKPMATNKVWSFKTQNAAPTTSVTTAPAAPNGANGWFVTNPTVTLTPDMTATTYYQWDSTATWNTYAAPFGGLEGQHTLYYFSVDTLNNTETTKDQLLKVDTGNPSSSITDPVEGQLISNVNYSVLGTASDGGSGLDKVEVSINGGAWNLATGTSSWSYNWATGADGAKNIKARATDAAGNTSALGAGVNVDVDKTEPQILSTVPTNGEIEVSIAGNITATFDEDADSSTINNTTFKVENASGTPVAGAVSYNTGSKTAVFDPNVNLAINTVYSATVTVGVKDLAGNNMATNKVWSFTTEDFSPINNPYLAGTNACDDCHSPNGGYNGVVNTAGSVGAKNNWQNGVYQDPSTLLGAKKKWCAGCHDDVASQVNAGATGNTSMTAPNIGGDKLSYGAYKSGHSKTAGSYDETSTDDNSGNAAASKECEKCHELNTQHLNTVNDTDVAGQRIKGTINGIVVSSVDGACKACHQNAAGVDAAVNQISGHGNVGEGYANIEAAFDEVGCTRCHEGHGANLNTNSLRNLKMIAKQIRVSGTSVKNAVYESRTGAKSLDDASTTATSVCRLCHNDSTNQGYSMTRNEGGDHTTTVPGSVFYGSANADKRGQDCTKCHTHDYKATEPGNVVNVANAFMPNKTDQSGCDGACHDASPATVTSGSHQTHLNVADVRGPRISTCDVCHGVGANLGNQAGHFNGIKNFLDSSTTVLSGTAACGECHSPSGGYNGVVSASGSIGAKNNWTTGVYTGSSLTSGKELWCAGCHDSVPSVINSAATGNTTMTAPAAGGNAAGYGAYVNGHSKTAGNYDGGSTQTADGNAAANKDCGTCHDFDSQHLNSVDDTNTSGQRIDATINGQPVGSVNAACEACHQNGMGNQVSDHGNSAAGGYSKIESAMGAVGCNSCHEPHGNNKNAGNNRNMRMIRDAVKVTPSVATNVVFETTIGANSLDELDGADSDDLCAACHSNGSNPGSPMVRHNGGDHTTLDTSSIFYNAPGGVADKRGQDCTTCHRHEYKTGAVASADGFMPGFYATDNGGGNTCATQKCHASTTVEQTSGSHDTHFDNVKGPGATTTCDTCHGVSANPNGGHTGHDNGIANFADSNNLAATGSCDSCHSPTGGYNGVNSVSVSIGAKDNWMTGVYSTTATLTGGKEKWCVGCHDSAAPTIGGAAAPAVGGNAADYGAYVSGHSKTAGAYDESSIGGGGGNVAAMKECDKCHDFSAQHLTGVDDTDTAGQRISNTINGQAISAVTTTCKACHEYETAGGDSATNANRVSQHGNSTAAGYTPQIEASFAINSCDQCHEPHGNNLSGATRNLKMIKMSVVINDTIGTTGAVAFKNRTGADSLDESDTVVSQDNDDMCATCHSNADNPGYATTRHGGGLHDGGGMGSDERNNDCTSCHQHNYQGDTSTTVTDGFMPAGCDACHGQPPVPAGTAISGSRKVENYNNGGGAHVRHVEELGFACMQCHPDPRPSPIGTDSTTHNQGSGIFNPTNVQVTFDTSPAYPGGTTPWDSGTPVETKSTTTTPATCKVGCHNPRPFKTDGLTSEPTSEGLSNTETWTANSLNANVTQYLGCARCHDSQGKAIDRQVVQGVQYTSGHRKVDTAKRADCLICHYIEPGENTVAGTADTTPGHKSGPVVMRDAEATGTPITWSNAKATQESFCLKCHDATGMQTTWRFSKSVSNTESVDIETNWNLSSLAAHDTSRGLGGVGYGCLGTDIAIGGSGCHGQPHGSSKRKLLAPSNVVDSDEETLCFTCHNTTSMPGAMAGKIQSVMEYSYNATPAQTYVSASTASNLVSWVSGPQFTAGAEVGKWFKTRADGGYAYMQVTANTATQLTLSATYGTNGGTTNANTSFYLRRTRMTHPTGETVAKHNSQGESTASANWNSGANRHVECEDCHNVHAAQKGNANTYGAIGVANKGVWGVAPTYSTVYNVGGATFATGSTAVTGGLLDAGTPSWVAAGIVPGYRIKNNYDMSGRWYTVTAVGGATALTISPAYDSAYTPAGALSPNLVDYTLARVTYATTQSPTNQAMLCLKCHSYFAYGTPTGADSPPTAPSGMYAAAGAAQAVPETEVGMDFNPNQMAYHPVLARGKNQPTSVLQNQMGAAANNWPTYVTGSVNVTLNSPVVVTGATATNWTNMGGSGKSTIRPGWKFGISAAPATWYEVKSVDSNTQITLTTNYAGATAANQVYTLGAGLGNAFVPPYGPWSIIACSDCHRYDSSTDVAGPHGSNNKWQLVEATSTLSFDWWANNAMNTISPNNIDIGAGSVVFSKQNFCFNCHRRDVYGDEGLGGNGAFAVTNIADNPNTAFVVDSLMSRIQHNPEDSGEAFDNARNDTRWGNSGTMTDSILCMQCHGGGSLGGLHGTNAKQGHLSGTNTYSAAALGANQRGERFLNGATWNGVTRATTAAGVACWTKSPVDEVNTCGRAHVGTVSARMANYNY